MSKGVGIIKSERAKLEKEFIDYMRRKHPSNEEFKAYILKCFDDDGYVKLCV
jgi:hypothetical protein